MLPMKLFTYGKNFTYIALVSYDATNVKNVVKICVPT